MIKNYTSLLFKLNIKGISKMKSFIFLFLEYFGVKYKGHLLDSKENVTLTRQQALHPSGRQTGKKVKINYLKINWETRYWVLKLGNYVVYVLENMKSGFKDFPR